MRNDKWLQQRKIHAPAVVDWHGCLFLSAAALNRESLEANAKLQGEIKSQNKWPEKWVMGCGLLLALSFLKYVYQPFQWLAVGAVAVGILPIIFKSIAAIRNCTLNVNILILIAGKSVNLSLTP